MKLKSSKTSQLEPQIKAPQIPNKNKFTIAIMLVEKSNLLLSIQIQLMRCESTALAYNLNNMYTHKKKDENLFSVYNKFKNIIFGDREVAQKKTTKKLFST